MNIHLKEEANRLYDLDYGEPWEIWFRLIGLTFANGLFVIYTGDPRYWAWSLLYLLSHAIYFTFLTTRKAVVRPWELVIATGLYQLVSVSFIWLPVVMATFSVKEVMFVGAALIGASMIFQVRRADTSLLMVFSQIIVITVALAYVAADFLPDIDSLTGRVGVVLSAAVLAMYFAMAIRLARKQRLEVLTFAARTLQEQKLAVIGQLAGGVAHDFNNNLTAILGNLELMQVLEEEDERQVCLNNAILASKQAAQTVRQLLVYARKEPMQLQPLDPNDLLCELKSLTQRLIPTSITLTIARSSDGALISADKTQLLTAMINLVVNAVDAMPDGGKLIVSARTKMLHVATNLREGTRLTPGRYMVIAVTDTGHGIPDKNLDRVLEPFFSTKPVGKGTGLGLAMVSGIARKMLGAVDIESSAFGSKVSILIPCLPLGHDARQPRPGHSPVFEG